MKLKVSAKQCPNCPCIMDVIRELGSYDKCRVIENNYMQHAGDACSSEVRLECVGCGHSEVIKGIESIADLEVE